MTILDFMIRLTQFIVAIRWGIAGEKIRGLQ